MRSLFIAICLLSLCGCGDDPAADGGSKADGGARDAGSRDAGRDDSGTPADGGMQPPTDGGVPLSFAPGFHQALRWSFQYSDVTTLRQKVPIGRAGKRVQVTFRAGDGALTISKATLAKAAPGGSLSSAATTLKFGGAESVSLSSRQEVTSAPIDFAVSFGDELYVSYEVQGYVASSAIKAFPDSFSWIGAGADLATPPSDSVAQPFGRGIAFIDVEALKTPVIAALGDSITEGYIVDDNETRNAWPFVAQSALGVPVVNSGVSGQDIWGERLNYQAELGPMHGLTDCVVMLGTNDLPCDTPEEVEGWMQGLLTELSPLCHVWLGTITPREVTKIGTIEKVRTCRAGINTWIRAQTGVAGIIDFDSVVRSDSDPDLLKPEYRNDGLHPTVAGQAALGTEAARVLASVTHPK